MKQEFNLSEKKVIAKSGEMEVLGLDYYWETDVKEFIQKCIINSFTTVDGVEVVSVNKMLELAGDKLG